MKNFAYMLADTTEAALSALGDGAAIAAGTTELLNWMRLGIAAPDRVIDISRLDDLRGISVDGGSLVVGALSTLNDIGESDVVNAHAPVLAEAALRAASAQLRNRATIGGNVLQKTRCPYFRAEAATAAHMPWPCNKRVPGAGCAAREGLYDRAALFGTTESCVATQPSDPAMALAALNAVAEVVGTDGPRMISMTEFHLTQAEAPDVGIESRLGSGEIILRYRIPLDQAAQTSAYLKVRERESYEYAMVSAAVCLDAPGGRIGSVRIALGAVAQKPWRLERAERALIGRDLAEASFDGVFEQDLAHARPLPGQEWKIRLAANTAKRAVMLAGGVN
jgi:xanthine dehydrogenase YagS FAD-binding subunit